MRRAGYVALVGFIACVFVANYSVQHWGDPAPGGIHTVTLGPWTAPSGVLFVGLSFTLRDLVQSWLGRLWVLAAILVGAAASYWVAPSLTFASAAAFLLSESADFALYTPLIERGRWALAVTLSNTVGAVVDSIVFLWLAFESLDFLADQVALKLVMVIPALVALRLWHGRSALLARNP